MCGFFSSICAEEIKPFKSDGCSLFPDGHLLDTDAWCECCVQHDIAYWQGGSEAQKEAADLALKNCVLRNTGNAFLAEAMYQGVKYGGHPIFPNWYRWGYGWSYGRGFGSLSENELRQVNIQLKFIDASCPE
jgi:hypothetical protein